VFTWVLFAVSYSRSIRLEGVCRTKCMHGNSWSSPVFCGSFRTNTDSVRAGPTTNRSRQTGPFQRPLCRTRRADDSVAAVGGNTPCNSLRSRGRARVPGKPAPWGAVAVRGLRAASVACDFRVGLADRFNATLFLESPLGLAHVCEDCVGYAPTVPKVIDRSARSHFPGGTKCCSSSSH